MIHKEIEDNWDDAPVPKSYSLGQVEQAAKELLQDCEAVKFVEESFKQAAEAKEKAIRKFFEAAASDGAIKEPKPAKSQKKPIPGVKCYKPKKKDGTRQLKVICPVCGYTCRTSRKWLDTIDEETGDSIGAPYCPMPHKLKQIVNTQGSFWSSADGKDGLSKMVEEKKVNKPATKPKENKPSAPISIDVDASSVTEKDGKISIQI